jgi:trk system potassium uptake protein TrkH
MCRENYALRALISSLLHDTTVCNDHSLNDIFYFFHFSMSRWFHSFLKPIKSINPAEATVISFLLMSLLGGVILWKVESYRTVVIKVPVIEMVEVKHMVTNEKGELTPVIFQEQHVFTRDVTQKGESFIDSLFTAVSALCVTGLTSTDFASYTLPGQIITMILIQMGGLGIIVFTSLFAMLIAQGLSERQTFGSLLAGILDTSHHQVSTMLRRVAVYTIFFEGVAFLIMGIHLSDKADMINGLNPWWWALFHSVSAFNNAGFGLLNNNLVNFASDPLINIVISGLIIAGGLGYPVLIALHTWFYGATMGKKNVIYKALKQDTSEVVASSVQTRVAITGTILLLALGTFMPMMMEWNSAALSSLSGFDKFIALFFQSVSTRTAGFNTIDIGALTTATLFLYMLLMVIGANPAGTAGGIKIPTVAVLYGYIKDWFQKPGEPVMLYNRRISKFAVSHAVRLFFFVTLFLGVTTFLLCVIEAKYLITPDPLFNFTKIIFELFSAFGTVGLSMGFPGSITSLSAIFSSSSKFLIIITMLFGRLGPLTILAALPWKRTYADHPLSPDFENVEKIQIG